VPQPAAARQLRDTFEAVAAQGMGAGLAAGMGADRAVRIDMDCVDERDRDRMGGAKA
jgi:hypothetical protein